MFFKNDAMFGRSLALQCLLSVQSQTLQILMQEAGEGGGGGGGGGGRTTKKVRASSDCTEQIQLVAIAEC